MTRTGYYTDGDDDDSMAGSSGPPITHRAALATVSTMSVLKRRRFLFGNLRLSSSGSVFSRSLAMYEQAACVR